MTGSRTSSCWRRNMAATARRSASAPEKNAPVASLPGHWAPNDLLIYAGNAFPAAYQGGAFVAFHGSWNRAPEPQGGYNVVFQPLKDGKAAGPFIVFADGFAGAVKEPGQASFRPSGLAMGPDGALYISEDTHGRIWRVTYHGDPDVALAPAASPHIAGVTSGEPGPPEGTHPDAGRMTLASLPVPPGATKEEVALGDRIYPRRSGRRHLHRLSWLGCKGLAAGAVVDRRQVAAKRRQPGADHADDHRRRAEAEELFGSRCRRAAARRCPTPMSPPSPLMSGRSAIRAGSSRGFRLRAHGLFRATGKADSVHAL